MKSLTAMAVSIALGVVLASAAAAQDQTTSAPGSSATQNPAVKSPDAVTEAPLARGRNSFTKSQALKRIERAGYTAVTGLAKDSDGLWHGQAMYNGKQTNVSLDYKGSVAPE